ncbi:hypothetical protein KSP39_PZI006399 [Platanthera zijinensis]|uniref:Uncharacterized protein n=1 Tax=Platanthera zijinensis TaxID=2320716 RepID=A0AAP0G9X4_9ASPA
MGEEASHSYHPAKRLRVDSTESQDLLADTASFGVFPSGRKKREKIQATVSALRRIIPGGKIKDATFGARRSHLISEFSLPLKLLIDCIAFMCSAS